MSKLLKFVSIVVLAGLLALTSLFFIRDRSARVALEDLKVTEQAMRDRYAQTVDAIAEIQDSLNAITVGDADVNLVSGNLRSEKDLQSPDGRDALDRIANLRAGIERNKHRIRQLESSLAASGDQVRGLRRMVADLRSSVAEKESQMAALTERVEKLQGEVTGLETTVEESQAQIARQEETLEERRREIATVYVVVGDRRQLTEAGVVVAKGGVLGLGKTLQPTGDLAPFLTRPLDTDAQTILPIPSPRARVVTPQPLTSYELRPVEGGMELRILDPDEFRKVRQLVIVTA